MKPIGGNDEKAVNNTQDVNKNTTAVQTKLNLFLGYINNSNTSEIRRRRQVQT